MPKTGRNDPCPCGSGKKYKHCCLEKDRAAELAQLAATRAELEAQRAERRALEEDERLAYQESLALDAASNAVVDLIDAGKLDEAEAASRKLLADYPDIIDGHMRLGMVFEKRQQNREAAACYRRLVAMVREDPDDYDPTFLADYLKIIDELDPPATPA